MVRGIEKFKEYFNDYSGQYTFIGGTACDILLGHLGENFRAAKDFDMVLLIETLNDDFVNTFISFIKDGEYEHIDKGTGDNQFYRFTKPKDLHFPYMIELFSRKPDYLNTLETRLAPIHVSDDAMSLSAILLNDEYYELLKSGVIMVEEVPVLSLEYIILFKMKAWLDLSERKGNGERVDSKDIRKHKNDVFRLAVNIDKDERVNITGQVREDASRFLQMIQDEPTDLKSLGLGRISIDEVLDKMMQCYYDSIYHF